MNPEHGATGVSLVGAGAVVRSLYLPLLRNRSSPFRVVSVFDHDGSKAAAVAEQLNARVAMSLEDAVGDPAVAAVFVCTPKEAHQDVVLAAVAHRRHVLCEKPLGRDGEDALELYSAVRDAGVAHMVNFVYRFRTGPAVARQLLGAGALGDIYHVHGTLAQGRWFTADGRPSDERTNATAWRYGPTGGVIRDLAPHLVDMCSSIGPVDWVQAWTRTFQKRVSLPEDAAGISLGFNNGAMAHLLVSRWATGYRENLSVEISGSLGAVEFSRSRATLWTRDEPAWRSEPSRETRTFLDTFHGLIEGTHADAPTFRDGAYNNLVLDALLLSAREATLIRLADVGVTEPVSISAG